MPGGEMRQEKEESQPQCANEQLLLGQPGLNPNWHPLTSCIKHTSKFTPRGTRTLGFTHQFPSHIGWKLPGN